MNTKRIKQLCAELEEARIPLDETIRIGHALNYFPVVANNAMKELEDSPLETPARAVFQAIEDYRKIEIMLQQKEINRIEEEIRLEASK